MTKQETINFMGRIKSHYQDFIINDFKINEWHKELSLYDNDDINQKLDEHLRSNEYGDSIPKLFFLTKYLIPSREKGKIKQYTIKCQLCEKEIPDTQYDLHYSRCSSANTIVRDFKKYFNYNVDYNQLMAMPHDKFELAYNKYLTKMLECDKVSTLRKKVILHCLYPNITIESIEDMLKTANNEI